jgi:hypothetical protein
MDADEPEAVEFRRRFPTVNIIDPVTFVGRVRASVSPP